MAGNTRGKLKEQFEGVHRNNEWIKTHLERALVLIKDHKPKLTKGIEALAEGYNTLDELAQKIYGNI